MKVAFYKARRTLFDTIVRLWTRAPYSHCELVLNHVAGDEYTCVSSSFRDGGVRIKVITLEPDRWDIVDVPFDVHPQEPYAWVFRHRDEGYDAWGLLGFVFRPIQGEPQSWFCSEAVADILGFPDPWRFDLATLFAVLTRRT